MHLISTLLLAAGFFVAGIVSRYLLQRVESRVQIAAFCVLAAAVALALNRAGWSDAAFAAAAAAIGILIMKFLLEGWNF